MHRSGVYRIPTDTGIKGRHSPCTYTPPLCVTLFIIDISFLFVRRNSFMWLSMCTTGLYRKGGYDFATRNVLDFINIITHLSVKVRCSTLYLKQQKK